MSPGFFLHVVYVSAVVAIAAADAEGVVGRHRVASSSGHEARPYWFSFEYCHSVRSNSRMDTPAAAASARQWSV